MTEREIFFAVFDRDLASRAQFLDNACAGDAALRARVEALLRSHETAGSFLGTPAVTPSAPPIDSTQELNGRPAAGQGVNINDDGLAFLQAPGRPDSLGRIGHYEVLQVLGRGAFGIVLRAFDETLQRVVALKVLAPEVAATSPARKRFLREARSSAQVRHENVVQVYEVGEQPLPYLAMEFIPGQTLQQRLDRTGPLDVPEVLRIGRQIAEGLAAAHAMDLIHRDIKPGNILLEGAQHKVKLTDFGLARAADDASISQSGLIAGTPMYMAPEQAKGETLDHRADLFSLGSVLYQMVSGRPPFRANSTMGVLKRVAEEQPRAIRELIPETPQWLCDIITKLHAKTPDDRFQSAREVAEVLADCEDRLKANARTADFPRIRREKTVNAGRWKWAAALALLLPLLALGVYALTPPAEQPGSLAPHAGNPRTPWYEWPADAPVPAVAPFDAAKAKEHQQAWATYLGVPVEYTNSIGMKFVLIPPGEFMMGGTPAEIESALKASGDDKVVQDIIRSQGPQHRVVLTRPFYLGVYEVTQAAHEKVMGANPSGFAPTGINNSRVVGLDTSDHPVELVSWYDAAEFCAKLSRHEHRKPNYFRAGDTVRLLEGNGYRLPTEAEWEFACRAGTTTRFWTGDRDEDLERAGWFIQTSKARSHAVGELSANPYGLYDVHGNAWEWVQDCWEPAYYRELADRPAVNPTGPSADNSLRVFRGGHLNALAAHVGSAYRHANGATWRGDLIGFRVALAVDVVKPAVKDRATRGVGAPPAPFSSADVERIAALGAAEQVEEVRKELLRRNPDFDGILTPTFAGDTITELEFCTDRIADIAPVRALWSLTSLNCRGSGLPGRLADLSPLQGMRLEKLTLSVNAISDLTPLKGMPLTHLHVDNNPVSDLMQLKGMSLKVLNCSYTQVSSLAPLQGMPLIILWANNSGISDLSPLRGMALEWITIHNTKVSNLSRLKAMPLSQIYLDFDANRDGALLRSITTLQKINDQPAGAFLKHAEK
jgi:serine/threonine protein kinase/formylglycine-generating enzyme required for sulfatase activity